MKENKDFVVVREYKADPPLPEGEIRVSILKRKEFDTTGYSFLRTSEVNGFDEYCPIERLDYYRRVFGITEEKQ